MKKPHTTLSVLSAQTPRMRDFVVHFAWLATHALRTVLERDPTTSILDSLTSEVKILQAELHRAHRLIEGYNLAFEREERAGRFQIRGIELFTVIIIVLTSLLWKAWYCPRRSVGSSHTLAVENNLSSESESETIEEVNRVSSRKGPPSQSRAAGPTRPSQLGKGAKR